MSERDETTAADLSAGAEKPGTDYGTPEPAAETGGAEAANGGDSGPSGEAVPDEPGAARAQEGVQEAFSVAPE